MTASRRLVLVVGMLMLTFALSLALAATLVDLRSATADSGCEPGTVLVDTGDFYRPQICAGYLDDEPPPSTEPSKDTP